MKTAFCHPVAPFSVDSLLDLATVNPGAFYLDSSDFSVSNKYSYFSYKPTKVNISLEHIESHSEYEGAPFWSGGYFGFVSYEGKSQFNYYPIVLVYDLKEKLFFATSVDNDSQAVSEWVKQLELDIKKLTPQREAASITSEWVRRPDFRSYEKKVERIKAYLQAGDVYQINLTEPFRVKTTASPEQIYKSLRRNNPSPYAAFINWGDFFILSASPELFFKQEGSFIQTKPIKGTRQRIEGQDEKIKADLVHSVKDQAELLMITDLERNDLGRLCQIGSVLVSELCQVETFATVHHLVATIQGRLKELVTIKDIFAALFPGGSVTGAPKIRAMEIIKELEGYQRGIYTGAIGYIGYGKALFNLPIRTMIYKDGIVDFSTGGGIIIDSTPQEEFEELWWKALGALRALGLQRPT